MEDDGADEEFHKEFLEAFRNKETSTEVENEEQEETENGWISDEDNFDFVSGS